MAPASATARIILTACFFFLLLSFQPHHVNAATSPLSFSFDFSNSSTYSLGDLRFEGDAALNGDLVDLTCNSDTLFCMGRMSYNHPVAFYDNNTGEVASFSTTFTFSINMFPNTTQRGDGMTFFLTGYPSRLLKGSYLGVVNGSAGIPTGSDRFIAIEFDTYNNGENEPTGSSDHIGIDVNSITSVSATRLPSYSLNGTMMATITFDNKTRMLDATLQFDADRSLTPRSVKTQLPDQLDALLPPVVSIGFSAATGGYSELHQIHSWSFNSTMAASETPTGANRFNPDRAEVLGIKDRQRRTYIIGGAVILAFALLLAIWWIAAWYRWKCTRAHFGKDRGITRFHYRDLSIATNKFSEIIGQGGFSVVYRGTLNNEEVAVKKIIKDSKGEFKDFLTERATIGNTRHMNVLKIEGWCCTISNFKYWFSHTLDDVMLFLVYELIANGNLHEHLYEKPEVLSWEKRYKIVKGLCSALHYLHHQCSPYILHRDIKPGNILLDSEFNAKLGDFGLSRVAEDGGETALQTRAVGTALYMDPLTMKDGHVDFRRSSDVYSFGIVLLEIAHGENDPFLVHKLRTDLPETFVKDFADKKLDGKFIKTEMERVILLGLRCTERDENQRPSLITATHFLENGGELRPATTGPA